MMLLPFIGVKANEGALYTQGNHLISITETNMTKISYEEKEWIQHGSE
jgi:hypothetical protein